MLRRMGLSKRLNLIIITINLVILVVIAILASTSSDAALRNQALGRFQSKSQNAFNSVTVELQAMIASAENITSWVQGFGQMNIATALHNGIVERLIADGDQLIHRVSVLRPDDTVVVVSIPDPLIPDQNARRVVQLDSQLNNTYFYRAQESTEPTWFRQRTAVFDPAEQTAMTFAIPYTHSTGTGLVWFDVPEAVLETLIIESLNREGFLFDTIAGYATVIDGNGMPLAGINVGTDANFARTARELLERAQAATRGRDGLYRFADPFNADQAGIFSVRDIPQTDWHFITQLPANEIPAMPANVLLPIGIVAAVGIIVLIFAVNRFVALAIVKPLVDLGRSATEIGQGNLHYIVFHRDKQDEVGTLANAMDAMRDRLRESYSTLQRWSATLEQRVDERTEQLHAARIDAEETASQLQMIYDESLMVVNAVQLTPILDAFLERMQTLLNATYCAIWLVEREQGHLQLVASTEADFQNSPPRIIGMEEGIVGQAVRLDQPVIVNDYASYPYRLPNPNGQPLRFNRAACAPLKSAGRVLGAVVVGRSQDAPAFDIPDERQLTLFTNMVAPAVRNAQLLVSLQQAVTEAESANQVKTRFLASVTHELRTPLNLIINNMDFMRIGAFGEVNTEQDLRLAQTIRSAEHLLYLINDLLDVSKIEAGEMQLFIQRSDVYTLIEDAVDNAYALLDTYPEKKEAVQLRVDIEDELPAVAMDVRRIRQVLNNLLSNAIKFTSEGAITLKVFQEQDGIHFSVHDTGMGIPDSEMDKLFTAFERTNAARQNSIEGTGLGLPISRYLVQQHGSDLTVISQEGVGSTFAFTLPLSTPDTSEAFNLTDTQRIVAILSPDQD